MVCDDIAVFTGLKFEADIVEKMALSKGVDLPMVEITGPGAPNADALVSNAKERGARGIVSFGVCGGLDPALVSGNVIIPDKIVFADGTHEAIATSSAWHEKLSERVVTELDVTNGALVSSATVIGSLDEKARLFSDTGAQGVDMESGPLALAAKAHGLEFVACRVVLDEASQAVPHALAEVVKSGGNISVFKLLKTLAFNWPGAKVLKELGRSNTHASDNLAILARLALPDFGFVG